ncbi:hypothetical protein [Streptomyces sp. NPDC056921]|uniref:hypothetical protein n=1 Tax=Streptomyces sp. NPDC056921 TaxID=3345966 RepID=UPI00363B78B8
MKLQIVRRRGEAICSGPDAPTRVVIEGRSLSRCVMRELGHQFRECKVQSVFLSQRVFSAQTPSPDSVEDFAAPRPLVFTFCQDQGLINLW